jgi:hypothetical protein
MSSSPPLPVADCPQLPVAERTSEEELQLIFEVESLQTQLSDAGLPVDEKFAQLFIQSVTPNKPLTERIRKWKVRRDHLQKMATPSSSRISGHRDSLPQKGPPDNLRIMPVVDNRDPQQRPGAGGHKRQQGNAQVDRPPPKRRNLKPTYCYKEREDGKPPEMLLIHVNFAQACVGWLKVNPALTGNDLIARFNASNYSKPEQYPKELRRGQKGSGRADHFF